ncbi:MAG: hypothetical protein JNK82_01800 [Myxococcaceae bacterium]|nr:hypothetical protein [Myxococcaceae bacterium]
MNERERTLWLLGATGSVGQRVLEQLGDRHPFAHIWCIGRREAPVAARGQHHHPVDFSGPFELPVGLVSDVVCALGSNYVTATDAELWRIDHDVPLWVAQQARERGAVRFVLVSTFGAHRFAPMLFARARGVLEHALDRVGFEQLRVLHPAFIADSHIARTGLERAAMQTTVWLSRCSSAFARSRLGPTSCEAVARDVVAALSR